MNRIHKAPKWNRDLTLGIMLAASMTIGAMVPPIWPALLAANAIAWVWCLIVGPR